MHSKYRHYNGPRFLKCFIIISSCSEIELHYTYYVSKNIELLQYDVAEAFYSKGPWVWSLSSGMLFDIYNELQILWTNK